MLPGVRLYHRTTQEAAAAILAQGFRDGEVTGRVELSSVPFDAASLPKAKSEALLAVTIPDEILAEGLEEKIVDPPDAPALPPGVEPYRGFLVPSEIVNRYGPPEIVAED